MNGGRPIDWAYKAHGSPSEPHPRSDAAYRKAACSECFAAAYYGASDARCLAHTPAVPITAGTASAKGAAAWLRKALARAKKGDVIGYRAALGYALADVGQALEETGQP